MSSKLLLVAATVATLGLLFGNAEAQAQNYSPCCQDYGNYQQTIQYVSYPSSGNVVYSGDMYGDVQYGSEIGRTSNCCCEPITYCCPDPCNEGYAANQGRRSGFGNRLFAGFRARN